MDGGASKLSDSAFHSSRLHKEYMIEKLPDSRGVFLRGMNEGRDSISGDVAVKRTVGTYQADALRTHAHTCQLFKIDPKQNLPIKHYISEQAV